MFAKEFRQARAQGRAEGLTRGVRALRQACLDVVTHFHPGALGRVAPIIETCQDLPTLRRWNLEAMRMPASEFVGLVTGVPASRSAASVRRAPRPARRAARKH
jgi:hypothetical protein